MINTFRSNTSNSATERLIDEIGKNNIPGSKHLVICPSNYGFTLEKLIHERLGLPGSFNIDVTSFSRYSYKKIEFKKPPIGTEGSVLLVKKVALEKKKELKHYFRVVDNINFASRMFHTLKLMKLNGYNADYIRAKAGRMEGATGDKLRDIAIILEAFEREISDKYTDTATRLEMLKEQVEYDNEIKKTHVYFTGFADFSVLELAVFEAFARNALSLNVSLVSGQGAPNGDYYPTRITNQITNLNRQNNLMGKETDAFEVLRRPVEILHKNILSYQPVPKGEERYDDVFVYAENNVYEELNGIAHEIVRLVRREGYRYKDINIINASSTYAPVMTQIFERYEIPCFVDIKYPLAQALSASFLLLVTETAKYSYRRDKVIALIKHPLFINEKLTSMMGKDCSVKEEIFLYENHILKNNINFSEFKKEDTSEEGSRFEPLRKRILNIIERFFVVHEEAAQTSIEENCANEEKTIWEDSNARIEKKNDRVIDLYNEGKDRQASDKDIETGVIYEKTAEQGKDRKASDNDIETGAIYEKTAEQGKNRKASDNDIETGAIYEKTAEQGKDRKASDNDIETLTLEELIRDEGEGKVINETGRKHLSIKEYISICRALLEDSIDALNNIVTKHRAGKSQKEGTLEEINVRASKILEELFLTAEQIIGDERGDVAMFDQYLKTLISQQSIAMIPRYLDSVFAGDLTTSYVTRPKVVFVIGASSSNLLSGKMGVNMLNPKDTQMMESNEMPVYPTEKDLVLYERYSFIDLISKFGDKLYIGYSLNNLKGEGEKPSEAITEIVNITGIKPQSIYQRFSLDKAGTKEKLEDAACSVGNTFFTYVASKESLSTMKDPEKMALRLSSLKKSLPSELINSLPENRKEETCVPLEDSYAKFFFMKHTNGNYKLSSSALESFFICPYSFFLKYGLGIKDREAGSIDPASIGTLVHIVLQEYFKSVKAQGRKYNSLSAEEIDQLGEEAIEKAFSEAKNLETFTKDPESKLKIENLKQECKGLIADLTENVAKGIYYPSLFEQKFLVGGKEGTGIELSDGVRLSISGTIDRVDVADIDGEGKRGIVVDYKTGGASSKGDISNVYLGVEIQPYIYMMGLKEEFPEYKPAGGVYLVLAENLNKDGKSYRFKGQIVTDEKNFLALDRGCFTSASLGEKSNSSVLPFDLKPDKQGGALPATSLYPISDLEKMEKMVDWIKELIKQAFSEINEGCFQKSPIIKKGCDNCFLRGACSGAEEKDYRATLTNTEAKDIFAKYFAS